MKRILALLLTIVMVFSLTACSKDDNVSNIFTGSDITIKENNGEEITQSDITDSVDDAEKTESTITGSSSETSTSSSSISKPTVSTDTTSTTLSDDIQVDNANGGAGDYDPSCNHTNVIYKSSYHGKHYTKCTFCEDYTFNFDAVCSDSNYDYSCDFCKQRLVEELVVSYSIYGDCQVTDVIFYIDGLEQNFSEFQFYINGELVYSGTAREYNVTSNINKTGYYSATIKMIDKSGTLMTDKQITDWYIEYYDELGNLIW